MFVRRVPVHLNDDRKVLPTTRQVMFKPGDLILSGEPFGYCLYNEERMRRCDFCFKSLSPKVSCPKCRYVYYCDRNCQRDGLKFHEHECHILCKRPLSTLTRVLGRITHRCRSSDGYLVYDEVESKKRKWDDLMDHYENVIHDAEAMHAFSQIFLDLESIIGEELDVREIVKFYGKILVNSFAVHDELMQPIGRALYLGVSIFDHSCLPNASFTFVGTSVYIKAVRQIEDLAQVRISYLDELNSCHERLRQLFLHYYFVCDCQRCNNPRFTVFDSRLESELSFIVEELDLLDLDPVTVYKNRIQSQFDRHKYGNNINKLMIKFIPEEKHEKFLRLINRINEVRKRIRNLSHPVAIKVCDYLSEVEEDIELALRVIDYFRAYYGSHSPRLAIKLFLTSQMYQVKPMLKLRLLSEAQKICEIFTPSKEQILRTRIGKDALDSGTINPSSVPLENSSLMQLVEKELNDTQQQIQSKVSISNSRAKWRSHSATRPSMSSSLSSSPSAPFSMNRYLNYNTNGSNRNVPSTKSFRLFPHSVISRL